MNDFIKQQQELARNLKCVNGAMYFGAVEDDSCNCKTRCQNEQTYEHALEELDDFITQVITQYHQDLMSEVLPFLKAYEQALECDWSINPVQTTDLVYRSPESVLRDSADAIEHKREMLGKLKTIIKSKKVV